ncbi:hypothetical protein KHA80_02935 [Anaerobacillus sp. HL2]|nr:hypothetical protein KHA80_02935 [Anaerobacillus sp. HL2]
MVKETARSSSNDYTIVEKTIEETINGQCVNSKNERDGKDRAVTLKSGDAKTRKHHQRTQ